MSKVLFLNVPSHGHVNPTLGLVEELVARGEQVIYFASEPFREKIEATGAIFKAYSTDLNIFGIGDNGEEDPLVRVIRTGKDIIADILRQIQGEKIDYLLHSVAFPFSGAIRQILNIPAASSLAVFMGMGNFNETGGMFGNSGSEEEAAALAQFDSTYLSSAHELEKLYSIKMPEHFWGLLYHKEPLNLVYTSEYFLPEKERKSFDSSYVFVGPGSYHRLEDTKNFPFGRLKGQKTLYISFGTVFGAAADRLYPLIFEAFGNTQYTVIMAAHNVDQSDWNIPQNFIVRDFVPQTELLQYTDVAITHNGLNTMNDLIMAEIPFVSIPFDSDQPDLAKRAEELGACVMLDHQTVTKEQLLAAVAQVDENPDYRKSLKKIHDSFLSAGGYKRAADEIFEMKRKNKIS